MDPGAFASLEVPNPGLPEDAVRRFAGRAWRVVAEVFSPGLHILMGAGDVEHGWADQGDAGSAVFTVRPCRLKRNRSLPQGRR
jgi:hypothetical protein